MAAISIRDLLRLRDPGCRSIGIVHAEEFMLLTIVGSARAQRFAIRKEPVNQNKFLVTTLMLVAFAAASSALAQNSSSGKKDVIKSSTAGSPSQLEPNDFIHLLPKAVRSEKKQIIAENMDLSDSEAVKFWPVYDQYAADLSKIYDAKIALLNDYVESYNNMTG